MQRTENAEAASMFDGFNSTTPATGGCALDDPGNVVPAVTVVTEPRRSSLLQKASGKSVFISEAARTKSAAFLRGMEWSGVGEDDTVTNANEVATGSRLYSSSSSSSSTGVDTP
ncbi:MAG: hypothetical protein ACK55I_17635, partial [bacterium]